MSVDLWRGWNIAVVVPAYCEERLLPKTLETMPGFVDRVIVVDDGSPDDTFEVAAGYAESNSRIEVIRLGFNYGVGRAIGAGYRRAVECGADAVAVMAADAQMEPSELTEVLEPIVEGGADYAKGDRLSHCDVSDMPTVRRFGTRLLALLTGIVAGIPDLRDSQCGYTAITADMVEALPLDELYPRYGYPNDLLVRLARRGARIAQPTVRPVYEDERSGLSPLAVAGPIGRILMRGAMRRFATALGRAVT